MADPVPPALQPILISTPHRWAALVSGLLLGAIGFLPLFAGPGYEAALAAGLILPTAAAMVTAVEAARRRELPLRVYVRGITTGTVLALIGYLIALLHGVRVGFCDPWGGSLYYWLGGGAGSLVGGAWGAIAGLLASTRRRRRTGTAILLAFLGPATGVCVSLLRFYTTPMVFAFDPFFGYFAGPLYDTVVFGLARLAWWRAGTACSLLAGAALLRHWRWSSGGLDWRWLPPAAWSWFGVGAALVSFSMTAYGGRFGHWSTAAVVQRALGRETRGERCTVWSSPSVPEREAALLAGDCDRHVAELETYFETSAPARITVFLFDDAAQKARLMGASRTQIAKPWRHEIYIQYAPFPHPVLRHELAHVVAGSFGQGPFAVGGPIRGIIPDPGRIEGVAEAAAPDEDADLTLQQWARAMRDLEQLPPLASVFRLTFLAHNGSTAYTVAGAFVDWLHSRYGPAVIRQWYGGMDLQEATDGKSLQDLEREWLESLDQVGISPAALHAARWRFDRPAIFGRRCPRRVDELSAAAAAALTHGDFRAAREHYEQVLDLDPGQLRARLGWGTCAVRAGNTAEARDWLTAISNDDRLTGLQRARAAEDLADLDLALGDATRARDAYAGVAALTLAEDVLRTLDLKRAGAGNPLARQSLVELLIGAPPHAPNWGAAAALLGRWSALDPDDGTPDYLLGRNFYQQGRWELAADHLDRALARHFDLPRVRDEALRIRLLVACALGDATTATRVYRRWEIDNASSQARQQGTRDRARRCGVEL